jgi:hypothetical protein
VEVGIGVFAPRKRGESFQDAMDAASVSLTHCTEKLSHLLELAFITPQATFKLQCLGGFSTSAQLWKAASTTASIIS